MLKSSIIFLMIFLALVVIICFDLLFELNFPCYWL